MFWVSTYLRMGTGVVEDVEDDLVEVGACLRVTYKAERGERRGGCQSAGPWHSVTVYIDMRDLLTLSCC